MTSARRVAIVFAVGALVGVVAAFFTPWQISPLLGWDVAAFGYVVWTWILIAPLDAARTQAVSTREDDSRFAAELLLIAAAVGSLAGIAVILIKAGQASGDIKALYTAVAVGTIAASWLTVHTTYTLKYAHQYYIAPVGGIDFKTNDPPDYRDFAYVAFTVGMTFQVSDTDIQSSAMRHIVLRHALLSFLFGAVILAVAVNIVASLI